MSRLGVWMLCCHAATLGGASFDTQFENIKRTATARELYRLLWAMPKGGDLHNHSGFATHAERWFAAATDPRRTRGNEYYTRVRFNNCADSTEPALLYVNIQRAAFQKLSPCRKEEYQPLASLSEPLKQQWISSLKLDRPGEGRNEFFEALGQRLRDLLRDPWLLAGLMVENMRLNADQGLHYLETQLNVAALQDAEGNLMPSERSVAIFREALESPAARATGLTVRFQVTVIRFLPDAEQALERAYAFVNANRDLWVGINMAGREDNDKGHPLRFLETFRKMRRTYGGIPLSLHGGEVDSPGPEVRRTLLLGADRIGHGVNLISDPDTMLLMRNGRHLVEVNLISNRLLEYVPDLDAHPFPEYLRTGIPVCLNTDDPGAWDSNITDEYFTAVKHFRLSWSEIVKMGRDSLRHSFAEAPVKARLLEKFDASIAAFESRFGGDDWREALKTVQPVESGYARRNLNLDAPRP